MQSIPLPSRLYWSNFALHSEHITSRPPADLFVLYYSFQHGVENRDFIKTSLIELEFIDNFARDRQRQVATSVKINVH